MGKSILSVCFLFGCLISACAFGKGFHTPREARLEILTSFTLALSKRKFDEAAVYLASSERARFLDSQGKIPEDYRERLRAMRLTTLMNNQSIVIQRGKIKGLFGILPVWEQDPGMARPEDVLPVEEAWTPPPEPIAAETEQRKELRDASLAFFKAVRGKRWRQALEYVDEQEREAFLDIDGSLNDAARTRLAAVDTSSWEALMLKDGKLTGVVLIVPRTGRSIVRLSE